MGEGVAYLDVKEITAQWRFEYVMDWAVSQRVASVKLYPSCNQYWFGRAKNKVCLITWTAFGADQIQRNFVLKGSVIFHNEFCKWGWIDRLQP